MFKNHLFTNAHKHFAGLIAGALMAPSIAFAYSAPTFLGKTVGEWSAKWWQWALAIPASVNPMLDSTGAFCNVNQKGPAWFLAGVFNGGDADRNCAVPKGKYILFPVVNSFWINSAWDDPHTETEYRQFANDFLPPSIGGDLEATLDGQPIIFNPRTPIVRSQSPVFTANFPIDNVFGLDPNGLTGYPIVSDGFWVMLSPLAPGEHVLHFRAGETQDITYYLTVSTHP
jgi:hypothetical protein